MNSFSRICGLLLLLIAGGSVAAQEGETQYWRDGAKVYLTRQAASLNKSYVKVVNDRGWQGGPIRVGGKTYARGLGVHSHSKLEFTLGGEFTNFHVVPGPDDAHHGLLQMIIFVDGKRAWDSGAISSQDDVERKPLDINVTGVEKLTLLVKMADGKRGGDHACWADAYLERPWTGKSKKATQLQPTSVPKKKLAPFFETYCSHCHGSDEQEANVRFDNIHWEIKNNDQAQRWQDVLDQLNGGDMPPSGEDQPTSEEMSDVLDELTKTIVSARNRLTDHGGAIALRRLNRREYANTIRELFGFDIALDDIPEDGEAASFDTVGAEQLFTSSDFQRYLKLGKEVGTKGFAWTTKRRGQSKVERFEAEKRHTRKLREKLADLDRKMEMKKAGKTWKEMGFKDEGEMKIVFDQFGTRAGHPRRYLQFPLVESGAYLCDVVDWVSAARHTDIRADYLVRIHGGVVGDPDELRKIVRISDHYGIKGTLKIQGTPENPKTVQFRTRQKMGRSQLAIKVRENMPSFTANTTRNYLNKLQGRGKEFDPWASIWLDYIEIEGPIYPKWRSRFQVLLYGNDEPGKASPYFNNDATARDFIERFAFEAFRRRSPDPKFVDALHERFLENRKNGQRYLVAMGEVVGIVLASPGFLYVHEDVVAGSRDLDNRELAIRLSYFLWSSPPDNQLYDANLLDPAVLEAQVERMLNSPKSKAFRDGFMSQWAELDRFDAITVEERKHIRFNSGLRHSAKQEVLEFFGTLLRKNLPVSNLIDSDFVTINPTLASHYGIPGVESPSDQFAMVKLPEGSPRGGLIGQMAFLMTGSNGERSSPVIRGALVMEKLLHDKPAPPPPNVPELGSASEKPKTNREMVKLHQKQAVCASCHKKMDVIGFGFENFDTIGAWRDTERVGRKDVSIDPSGVLPGGARFEDIQSLKALLLKQEDKLIHELTESILSYALGRTVEFSDANEVERLVEKIRQDDGRIRTIIKEIALSPLFRQK